MFSYQASLGNAKMGPKPDGCKAKHLTHQPTVRVAHDDSHQARASNKPKRLHKHLYPTASYRKANHSAPAPQPPLHANLSSSASLTLTTSLNPQRAGGRARYHWSSLQRLVGSQGPQITQIP